jgi:hypothetical protein
MKTQLSAEYVYKLKLQKEELQLQMDKLFEEMNSGKMPKAKVIQKIGNLQSRLNDLTAVVAEHYPTNYLESK